MMEVLAPSPRSSLSPSPNPASHSVLIGRPRVLPPSSRTTTLNEDGPSQMTTALRETLGLLSDSQVPIVQMLPLDSWREHVDITFFYCFLLHSRNQHGCSFPPMPLPHHHCMGLTMHHHSQASTTPIPPHQPPPPLNHCCPTKQADASGHPNSHLPPFTHTCKPSMDSLKTRGKWRK